MEVLNTRQGSNDGVVSEEIPMIAIQGGLASYHDIASRQYFGKDLRLACCASFTKLFDVLEDGKADFGIMAIENSVAGTILPNYRHLQESSYLISGEVYLRIEHQLMALPGQSVDDLSEVRSHPMALLQCKNYLKAHPSLEQIQERDTALCAEDVSMNEIYGVGVIASKMAATHFGLDVLEAGIEDNKRNFTRFLVLEKKNNDNVKNEKANKSSVCFHLDHDSGSLATALTLLSGYGMNLTKIQSLPHIGKEWQYNFFLDMIFDDYERYTQALDKLRYVTKELTILGEYTRGEKPQY